MSKSVRHASKTDKICLCLTKVTQILVRMSDRFLKLVFRKMCQSFASSVRGLTYIQVISENKLIGLVLFESMHTKINQNVKQLVLRCKIYIRSGMFSFGLANFLSLSDRMSDMLKKFSTSLLIVYNSSFSNIHASPYRMPEVSALFRFGPKRFRPFPGSALEVSAPI